MEYYEEELKEYIENLCETKNIPIDLRFACFGDANYFFTNDGTKFSFDCTSYCAEDKEDIKQMFVDYLDYFWIYSGHSYNRMVLYIENIVDKNGWYKVVFGGALIEEVQIIKERVVKI